MVPLQKLLEKLAFLIPERRPVIFMDFHINQVKNAVNTLLFQLSSNL